MAFFALAVFTQLYEKFFAPQSQVAYQALPRRLLLISILQCRLAVFLVMSSPVFCPPAAATQYRLSFQPARTFFVPGIGPVGTPRIFAQQKKALLNYLRRSAL